MKYMGGKTRIVNDIARIMLEGRGDRDTYLEPFVGGGSVAAMMAPRFGNVLLTDMNKDLIMMWQALQQGWEPPKVMSEAEWRALKTSESSALRAFAGFGCSFGGKWFAGYAHPSPGRDHVRESANSLMKKLPAIRHARFEHRDYRGIGSLVTEDAVVYCDPPYQDTTAYGAIPVFRHAAFWRTAAQWSNTGALVFVSEYNAPEPWKPVWEGTPQASLGLDNTGTATERLYALPSTIERAGLKGYARRYAQI